MATLEEHKTQARIDTPEGSINSWVNGEDIPMTGTAYETFITDQATELLRVETEGYEEDRAKEYPSFADQFDDIFHNGIDAWKATIQVTKDKYPKP